MKIDDVMEELDLKVIVEGDLKREVKGGYICDLLSNVMARAQNGDLWLTVQGHQNIVAIAALNDLAGVVVVEDFAIDDDTIKKAKDNNINLFKSSFSAYQLASKLYELGIE